MAHFEALHCYSGDLRPPSPGTARRASPSLELASELRLIVERVAQHDRDLANQLRRAATSVPSCLSEGAQRTGKDRLHLFRISAGSSAEIKTQLKLAVAWGYLELPQAAMALTLADRMVAITWRLTRPRS